MSTSNEAFLKLYFRMFVRPGSAFEEIRAHPHRLRYGFYAFLVPALGYTLFYLMAWQAGGAPSTFKPWLALPIEEYFRYDIFLTLPGYFLSWIAAAGVVHLLATAMKAQGNYDDILIVIAFGIGVATWSSMLHDLTDAFLGYIGVIDIREYEKALNSPTFWRYLLLTLYVIYFSWFFILFRKGIKRSRNTGGFGSTILAIAGIVVFQLVLLIFIR
jgi:hypothetical protein